MTKRLPREACLDLGDVKVVKAVVTFREKKDEDTLVEKGHQIGRGTVFLRDTCQREIHQRNIRTTGSQACFDLDDVKVGETHCDL